MAAQPQERVRKRLAWLSPYLLAVALFPALLGFQYTCNRGDTYLLPLQVEVGGFDQIDSFHPDTRYYDIAISGDNVLLRAVTRDATSTASYQLLVDGTPVEGGQLGVGGGEVTLGVAVGQSTLRVSVRATEGGLGHYEVDVTRLPKFACTEQGILDAIAFGGGPHFFDCNGPTTVTTLDEIFIDNDVILDGEEKLTVDGNQDHRVFSMANGVEAELRGFTVSGGTAGVWGGGIFNGGTLTLTNSTVSGNTAGNQGGGIRNGGAGTVTLTNSTVSGNTSTATGGGIANYGGEVTLTNSALSGNTSGFGGGIYTTDGTVTLTNSTVSGNTASYSSGGTGGGIHMSSGMLTLTNSTVSGNASNGVGGIDNGGTMTVTNTLIDDDCSGTITSGGGNIESPGNTCGFDQPTDQVSVPDPMLGPLQNNGGPTMTHALLPGSVAIDHVPAAICVDHNGDPLTTDQRGVARPQGAACDAGAFEFDACTVDSRCNDGNECSVDQCDTGTGSCTYTNEADGTSCGVDGVCEAGACREWSWGTPVLIETNNIGTAHSPHVAVDPDGNATAVWSQHDGVRNSIWSNRYTPGSGWGTAVLIQADDVDTANSPHVAVDPDGNATAVWSQHDGARFNIWSNRYTPGSGWGTPILIESDNAGAAGGVTPQVAVDPAGNAIAVWLQHDGVRNNIWSNRYTPGSGWGMAVLIEAEDPLTAHSARVGVDAAGNATAVWIQHDGVRNNIWSNRYISGFGWGTAVPIEAEAGAPIEHNRGVPPAQVAVDPAGTAVAVWQQTDGVRNNTWSNRYTPGSGWGTAVLIQAEDFAVVQGDVEPDVAVDPAGNATAVWLQHDGVRGNIWSNRYTPGSGWGTAVLIETDDTSSAQDPQVVVDSNGGAVVVWQQNITVPLLLRQLWSNHYTPNAGWATPVRIQTNNANHELQPAAAANAGGGATVVWKQTDPGDTYGDIWSNRFE